MKKSWHVQGLGSNIKCCAFTYRVQNWGELPWINSYGCLVKKDWWNTCGSLVSFGNGAGEGGLTDRKYVVFLLRPFLHGLLSFFIPSSRTHPPSIPSFWYFRFYFSMCFFPRSVLSSVYHHPLSTFPFFLILFWHLFWHSIWHPLWHLFWHFSLEFYLAAFWWSIWHLFWHSFRHLFWHFIRHSIWPSILPSIWHLFWHSILPFYLAFILALFLGILSDILFCHSIWHSFWHCFWQILWHPIWHSFWHLFWHFIFHSIWHPFRHSFWDSIWHLFPPDLAVEIRHCPLRSGVRSWSPEVPAEIWSSQLAGRRKKKKKEEQVTLRKSRDSHLAGGEKDRSTPKSTKQADPTLAQMWERFAW